MQRDEASAAGEKLMKTALMFLLLFLTTCVLSLASPSQSQDTAVIDQFIAKQATQENGEEYAEARKVLTGDLNRHGVSDLEGKTNRDEAIKIDDLEPV